jgi:hypothetical protein
MYFVGSVDFVAINLVVVSFLLLFLLVVKLSCLLSLFCPKNSCSDTIGKEPGFFYFLGV